MGQDVHALETIPTRTQNGDHSPAATATPAAQVIDDAHVAHLLGALRQRSKRSSSRTDQDKLDRGHLPTKLAQSDIRVCEGLPLVNQLLVGWCDAGLGLRQGLNVEEPSAGGQRQDVVLVFEAQV